MTIELRHIEQNTRLSEETPCYSADLFWNGKKVACVSNHGHGGPDMVRPIDKAGFEEAVAFVKALPPVPSGFADMEPLAMDLELWCHMEVGKVEERKAIQKMFRKDIKTSVLYVKDDGVYYMKWKGVKAVEQKHIDAVRAKYPDVQILNGLPEAEALAIYAPLVVKAA